MYFCGKFSDLMAELKKKIQYTEIIEEKINYKEPEIMVIECNENTAISYKYYVN